MTKFVNPALKRNCGLPRNTHAAKTPNATTLAHVARRRAALLTQRSAMSVATHASAPIDITKVTALHCTYGTKSPKRSNPAPLTKKVPNAHKVECNDGYHWFHATDPSVVGQVVDSLMYVFANVV